MKKLLFIAVASLGFVLQSEAQEYKIITVIESIIPGGTGRSRIIEHQGKMDYKALTTNRTGQKGEAKSGSVKRGDAKLETLSETKILNFYSMSGINFENIASNDAVMSSKINDMIANGWSLAFVNSAVEAHAGKPDSQGLFITRYIFKK